MGWSLVSWDELKASMKILHLEDGYVMSPQNPSRGWVCYEPPETFSVSSIL